MKGARMRREVGPIWREVKALITCLVVVGPILVSFGDFRFLLILRCCNHFQAALLTVEGVGFRWVVVEEQNRNLEHLEQIVVERQLRQPYIAGNTGHMQHSHLIEVSGVLLD